jgi:hypothetical protein
VIRHCESRSGVDSRARPFTVSFGGAGRGVRAKKMTRTAHKRPQIVIRAQPG